MRAELHKPNWLFRGLILLSVGLHAIVLMRVAPLHHPETISRIALTLQSSTPRPHHRIAAPPAPLKNMDDRQPPPLRAGRQTIFSRPQTRQPEAVAADRLKPMRSVPQIPELDDPVATVWEAAPASEPATVVPPPSTVTDADALREKQYIDRIQQQIETEATRTYPQRARRRHVEGVVSVLFTIGSTGALVSIDVSSSSGSRLLDRSAVKAVQKAAPFDAPPNGAVTLELPIRYRLVRS